MSNFFVSSVSLYEYMLWKLVSKTCVYQNTRFLPTFNEERLLTRPESVFSFFILLALNKNLDVDLSNSVLSKWTSRLLTEFLYKYYLQKNTTSSLPLIINSTSFRFPVVVRLPNLSDSRLLRNDMHVSETWDRQTTYSIKVEGALNETVCCGSGTFVGEYKKDFKHKYIFLPMT